MSPPKKTEDPVAEEENKEEEPVEPEISQRCFRVGGQVYYGECKTVPGSGVFVRQGHGHHVTSAFPPTGNGLVSIGFGRKLPASGSVGEPQILGTYEGEFHDDMARGTGKFKWRDGSSYTGSWAGGEMHGPGHFEWPEGSVYEGSFHKGQLSGHGRYDSKFDGGFLQGHFNRNCFQQRGGRWTDVSETRRKAEEDLILYGDVASVSVRACSDRAELPEVLAAVHAEGLVPFVVGDSSIAGPLLAWLPNRTEKSTARVRDAAVAMRQYRDYGSIFYDAIQAALVSGGLFTVVLEAEEDAPSCAPLAQAASGEETLAAPAEVPGLPMEWRLSKFYGPLSFPLEIFNVKLFNGRGKTTPFLPKDLQEAHAALFPQHLTGVGLGLVGGEELPEGPGTVYDLWPCILAEGRFPCGLPTEELRRRCVARFGRHVPLHRTVLVVLSEASAAPPEAEALPAPKEAKKGGPAPPVAQAVAELPGFWVGTHQFRERAVRTTQEGTVPEGFEKESKDCSELVGHRVGAVRLEQVTFSADGTCQYEVSIESSEPIHRTTTRKHGTWSAASAEDDEVTVRWLGGQADVRNGEEHWTEALPGESVRYSKADLRL